MIQKYGAAATIRRTNSDGTVSTFNTFVLKVNTVNKVLGESAVQLGDDHLLMQSGTTPIHGDRIVYKSNGATENRVIVQPVDTQDPAGDVIYIECYARKG